MQANRDRCERTTGPWFAQRNLGGFRFRGRLTGSLRVLFPQLLRLLGCPREVLLRFLLLSPVPQHLRVTQWNLRSMSSWMAC
jgi:hypothetical protein